MVPEAAMDPSNNSSPKALIGVPAAAAFRLGYRHPLDGLRGIAILGVVAVHAGLVNNRAAMIGVDLFFVLSGFLITTLLVAEWDRRGAISLRHFYYRRILRLLPALLVLLIATVGYYQVARPGSAAAEATIDGLIALFYSSNWALGLGLRQPGVFAHTWSLSIEEQFYILWPWILILLLRRSSSRLSLLNWILLGVFVFVIERVVLIAGTSATFYRLYFGTDTRADSLLLGCIAGVVVSSGWLQRLEGLGKAQCPGASRLLRCGAWASISGLAFLTVYDRFEFWVDHVVISFLIPLLAVPMLLAVVVQEDGLLAQILSQRWLVYVGRVSYGLYLWHCPIFGVTQAQGWPPAQELAVEFSLTAAVVLASYYLLERPLLRLKARNQPILDRGSGRLPE